MLHPPTDLHPSVVQVMLPMVHANKDGYQDPGSLVSHASSGEQRSLSTKEEEDDSDGAFSPLLSSWQKDLETTSLSNSVQALPLPLQGELAEHANNQGQHAPRELLLQSELANYS